MSWNVGEKSLHSRMILGTARYPSPESLQRAIERSGVDLVTVSLRRHNPQAGSGQSFWNLIQSTGVKVLPNTAGCHTAEEAVALAHLARELFSTHWIKLEVTGDEETLQPDPFELVKAAEILARDGFEVFPYMTEDLVVAEKLIAVGCRILMPWGAPIGTGQGLRNPDALLTMRKRFPEVSIVVDAGIGAPSHAALAMELGMDAVLLNSAVALATDPPAMAEAFSLAVKAGRSAYLAGLMPERDTAEPSTPLIGVPFWHDEVRA